MISKRTLEKWRKEALIIEDNFSYEDSKTFTNQVKQILSYCDRIKQLTQELLDQQLLNRKGN